MHHRAPGGLHPGRGAPLTDLTGRTPLPHCAPAGRPFDPFPTSQDDRPCGLRRSRRPSPAFSAIAPSASRRRSGPSSVGSAGTDHASHGRPSGIRIQPWARHRSSAPDLLPGNLHPRCWLPEMPSRISPARARARCPAGVRWPDSSRRPPFRCVRRMVGAALSGSGSARHGKREASRSARGPLQGRVSPDPRPAPRWVFRLPDLLLLPPRETLARANLLPQRPIRRAFCEWVSARRQRRGRLPGPGRGWSVPRRDSRSPRRKAGRQKPLPDEGCLRRIPAPDPAPAMKAPMSIPQAPMVSPSSHGKTGVARAARAMAGSQIPVQQGAQCRCALCHELSVFRGLDLLRKKIRFSCPRPAAHTGKTLSWMSSQGDSRQIATSPLGNVRKTSLKSSGRPAWGTMNISHPSTCAPG